MEALSEVWQLVPFVAVGLIIESLSSHRPVPERSASLNLVVALIFLASRMSLGAALALMAFRAASHLPGFQILPLPRPHSVWGIAVQAFGVLAVHDICYYWMHRVQHENRWLWAEHALHHSDESVNVTTAWRVHWLEPVVEVLFMAFPTVYLFGPDVRVAVSVTVVTQLMSVITHANVPWRLPRLERVIATPAWHRVHHSILPHHIDRNYGAVFAFWDVLFGTYTGPDDAEPPTGLVSRDRIDTARTAALYPFTYWRRLRHERARQHVTEQSL